ncbi:MAG: asparagine--tRNA ligase [Patescibacteria group bacterium]|nr:asparagine--tRNA ligase [Patescibacteria group bacterium]
MPLIQLSEVSKYPEKEVSLKGWVFNVRSSGSIYFLQFRDGSGRIQAVISKKEVDSKTWQACGKLTMESSIELFGTVHEDKRSAYGFELEVKDLKIIQLAEEYPIAKKEHGPEFLMDNRHLWLRSARQAAILKVRDEVVWQLRKFFRERGFVLTDSPVLTPTSCEGTTTLFSTDYFDTKAYLAQTGQLYIEATAAALGRVYDFGPTFRAEKSKTRRHLTEFWMLDAEAAFVDFEENLKIQEELVSQVVQNILIERREELKLLERDTKILEKVAVPFPRLTYDEAVTRLIKAGLKMKRGDDFGGDEETVLSKQFDKPVFITHFPTKIKAFYMKPDPADPELSLGDDLLAPEGFGEIIGGSERIDDLKLLEKRLKEFKLPRKDFEWYLDLRRYGSFPHSGFGLGLERLVRWICGLEHIRETIPFPRLINRLKP